MGWPELIGVLAGIAGGVWLAIGLYYFLIWYWKRKADRDIEC